MNVKGTVLKLLKKIVFLMIYIAFLAGIFLAGLMNRQGRGKFECHLDDAAHRITGNLLAGELEKVIPGLMAEKKRHAENQTPAGGRKAS